MRPAVRGRLVGPGCARELLSPAGHHDEAAARRIEAWWERCDAALGPASSVRTVADVALVPLLAQLGFSILERADQPDACWLRVGADGRPLASALALAWDAPITPAWRDAVRHAIAGDARWCYVCNGTLLRLLDARRTWSRDYLEFDLAALAGDAEAVALLGGLAGAAALAADPPRLDQAAELSQRRGRELCLRLGAGVLEALQRLAGALRRRACADGRLFDESLTVLYRVLFLLFAEARGLVPLWHPVYRDRYSLDAIVTTLLAGRSYRGLAAALQAISRLAHDGCSAGELRVTAFNGRLFAPAEAAALDRARLDDDLMGEVVLALASVPDGRGGSRARVAYRDLDVEQLGGVYERLLDYEPSPADGNLPLRRTGDARKATGTFYTPRAMTAWLVERTLGPLVAGRQAEEILALRVLDPAMGSGAFLVAACRYLAGVLEAALVREGALPAGGVTAADRARLRREVASRCLFGVDANPMAVQLARLSLWLATLAADRPLSFLDHRLVAGDSLVGASPHDLLRQPGGHGRRQAALPLFEAASAAAVLADSARVRERLAREPDDSAAVVRAKERALGALRGMDAALTRWTRVLDLWCAGWFWEDGPPDRGIAHALADRILHGARTLPDRIARPLEAQLDAIADRHRFLHWPLAFPEVFVDGGGAPAAVPGFDAVVGNPPWDMVRGDSGDARVRGARRRAARQLVDFVRGSGIYHVDVRAHANRYQLFVERALQLTRRGGRVGLVLPSGLLSDAGAAPLRRHLFARAEIDEIAGFDNREAVFPVHRGLRFALVTATAGRETSELRVRFGLRRAEELERAAREGPPPLRLTRRLLARLSGDDDLGVPEVAAEGDLRLLERIAARWPALSDPSGWHVHFGRELNASDDRALFEPYAAGATRPVVEGKGLEPFRVALPRSRYQLRPGVAVRVPRRPRLAYRDVASATNRLTLIAALVPARAVTTHTLFCLREALPVDAQHVLCALLNSYVANYLVRFRVHTHVTVALVSRLPVPPAGRDHPAFARLLHLARTLARAPRGVEEMEEYAELQAAVAHLYGLTRAELAHVLTTFPLVSEDVRARAMARFDDSP